MPHPDPRHKRAATDRGLTGDKIAALDPAAAPPHTDAEAAGVPTPAIHAGASARELMDMAGNRERIDDFGARTAPHKQEYWPMVALVAVMILLGLLMGWWGLR